jgi:phosphate transport system protein
VAELSANPNGALPQAVFSGQNQELVTMTLRACELTRSAAAAAADAIAGGGAELFEHVSRCEQQLDEIDREMDEAVVFAISNSNVKEARELLACLKFVIDLERVGDLVSSFCSRAAAVRPKLEQQDIERFIKMASVLEQMVKNAGEAFRNRDLNLAIHVMRTDAEMDRLRNLLFLRHVGDYPEVTAARESVQVLFMAHALERAGDHAKNLGEEVCHYVSGRTVRHVLRSADKPYEQLFLDWLREKQAAKS